MPNDYARVAWVPEDVQALRPWWSLKRCAEWLEKHASWIANAMIEAGWDTIENNLPKPETEGEELRERMRIAVMRQETRLSAEEVEDRVSELIDYGAEEIGEWIGPKEEND